MDLIIVLVSLTIILGFIDFLSSWFFYRSKNYMWIANGIFTVLFVGYWVYRIQHQSSIEASRRLQLKEDIYNNSNISKARESLLFHNLWDYYIRDRKTLNREQNRGEQIQSIFLLACCVQTLVALFRLKKGKRKFPKMSSDYQKQTKFYWIMFGVCTFVYLLPLILGA